MQATAREIDDVLAAALRGQERALPGAIDAEVLERIRYHGIGGLLAETDAVRGWSTSLRQEIRDQATAQAMWEMRHRQLLAALIERLAASGIACAVLKGTALAYGYYDRPHVRGRSDTDLLVATEDVSGAREALRNVGFKPSWGEMRDLQSAFQEGWECRHDDNSFHQIDLHWQAINARALSALMPVADCLTNLVSLVRLSDNAQTLEPARLLLHTCIHRQMHRTAPFMLGGTPYFGAKRLIWAMDILRLIERFDDSTWTRFTGLAIAKGIAPVCLDAFDYADQTVGLAVPAQHRARLAQAPKDNPAAVYLLRDGRTRRILRNLSAGGGAKAVISFVGGQLFPSAEVLRVHYPSAAHWPVPALLVRRWAGLLVRNGR